MGAREKRIKQKLGPSCLTLLPRWSSNHAHRVACNCEQAIANKLLGFLAYRVPSFILQRHLFVATWANSSQTRLSNCKLFSSWSVRSSSFGRFTGMTTTSRSPRSACSPISMPRCQHDAATPCLATYSSSRRGAPNMGPTTTAVRFAGYVAYTFLSLYRNKAPSPQTSQQPIIFCFHFQWRRPCRDWQRFSECLATTRPPSRLLKKVSVSSSTILDPSIPMSRQT